MKTMIVPICGEDWRVNFLSTKAYEKKRGKDSWAWTDEKTKEMDFVASAVTLETVIHEIFHAHHVYLHLGSVHKVTLNDHEEIIAEMLEKRIFDILRISRFICSRMISKKKK